MTTMLATNSSSKARSQRELTAPMSSEGVSFCADHEDLVDDVSTTEVGDELARFRRDHLVNLLGGGQGYCRSGHSKKPYIDVYYRICI